jgi:hypothetical protein
MKKTVLLVLLVIAGINNAFSQCTTTNATGCQCKDATQTDCDLLPDIEIGHPPFYQYDATYGIIEYSQTGNGVDNGRLKISVSTPNTGHGPLELRTTNIFVCGTDTFVGTAPSICPDGISYPRILINQRIYHKSGNNMTYYDRPAGTMTYHPTHGHMHVDNWGTYTLRTRDTLEPNPLNWPMVGSGTKLAFCVMDYGECDGANYTDHCLDTAGNPLNNASDFPNYGLGGGQYNCSPSVQGISSGYLDIYWTSLDGMWIDIPAGTCNGDYWVVTEVDPNGFFLEEYENNNVYAAPVVISRQEPNPATTPISLGISGSQLNLCQGESVTITAGSSLPGVTYQWVTGDTSAAITVDQTGTYTVNVTNACGSGVSLPVNINVFAPPADPIGVNDTITTPGTALLSATGSGSLSWWDAPSGGTQMGLGSSFTTPFINNTTTYYVEDVVTHAGQQFTLGPANNTAVGGGSSSNANQALIFDCLNPFTLHAVDVYAQTAGTRTIVLEDANGTTIQSAVVNVVAGLNTVVIDFNITPGTGYQLTRTGGELYRNNPGTAVGFPFTIDNFCSITGTTAGANYYYFFYNWDIRLPDNSCTSSRVPVTAVIESPNTIAEVAEIRSLKVYPNPAGQLVNVSFENSGSATLKVELIDAIGNLVAVKSITPGTSSSYQTSFDVSGIARGVYSVHILSDNKNYYHKLIIQ